MTAKYIDSLKNPKIKGFEWQQPEDESDRKAFNDILEYGCQVISIEADARQPEYAFSVGLYLNFLHPEILIMGVSNQASHKAINDICHAAASGKKLLDGDIKTGLREITRPVKFITVPKDRYFDYLGYASWFYRSVFFSEQPVKTHKFPVLQALWPDTNGFYPDDDRCNETVRKVQTLVPQQRAPSL